MHKGRFGDVLDRGDRVRNVNKKSSHFGRGGVVHEVSDVADEAENHSVKVAYGNNPPVYESNKDLEFVPKNEPAMNFKPLNDNVIVLPDESPETTPGGIVLPERSKERPRRGKVIAVGGGIYSQTGTHRPLAVKVGDSVIFGQYSGHEFKTDDDKKVLIMKESDIFSIVD